MEALEAPKVLELFLRLVARSSSPGRRRALLGERAQGFLSCLLQVLVIEDN
jgi:hypothetical protein